MHIYVYINMFREKIVIGAKKLLSLDAQIGKNRVYNVVSVCICGVGHRDRDKKIVF